MLLAASPGLAQPSDAPPDKKLVKVGWDGTTPQVMLDNLETMKQMPFDGYAFRFPEVEDGRERRLPLQNVITVEPYDDALFDPHRKAMRELATKELGPMTDNMVMIWFTGRDGWDWFDDEHWASVESNWRRLAELAALSDSDILLDPESYYTHLADDLFWVFNYQDNPRADEKSFDEYREIVRERGRSFIRVLREVDPEMEMLSMYGLNTVSDGVLAADTPEQATAALEAQVYYNLLPAFIIGMLEEAHDGFTFHDGNERAYYYTTPDQFSRSTKRMKEDLKQVVPADLHDAYDKHYRAGHAIYASDLYPADPEAKPYRAFFRLEMARDRMAEMVAHNVYHALDNADKYAWAYTEEDIDFWRGDVPHGLAEALNRGKSLALAGEPFPPEVAAEVVEAAARYRTRQMGNLLQGTGTLANASKAPAIDGNANDDVWLRLQPNGPMHPPANDASGLPGDAATVRFAADGDHLYVLVEAEDSQSDNLQNDGDGRDGDVWRGDDVELVIADPNDATVLYLLMVNPAGTIYDARLMVSDASDDPDFDTSGYDPKWRSAVKVHDGKWVAELAVPWDAIGGRPRNDQTLRLNVGRGFGDRAGPGFVSWSQVAESFLDPQQLGELRAAGN